MAIRSGVTSFIHRVLLGCVALVLISGCELMRDPTAFEVDDGPIAIHGMLVAGEQQIAVLVTRYESGAALGRTHRLVAVAGADVRVTRAGQTITLEDDRTAEGCIDIDDGGYGVTEVPASLAPGCYTGWAEDAIVAGAQYELHISLDDGTIVTGRAEVPRPVTIRTPKAGARIEVWSAQPGGDPAPSHALAWSDAGPNRAVQLWLEVDYENCQGPWTAQQPENGESYNPAADFDRAIDLTGRDSADVGGWFLSCDEPPPDKIDGALQLAVFDLAYAQYLDTLARSESIVLADASLGLNGAVGVFTATAVTRVPVRLVVRCPIRYCPWPD